MLAAQEMGMTGSDYVFIMNYYLFRNALQPWRGWEHEADPVKLAALKRAFYAMKLVSVNNRALNMTFDG